jgi:hypothetical protein
MGAPRLTVCLWRQRPSTNVLANPSLVEAQCSNVAFPRETTASRKGASRPAT